MGLTDLLWLAGIAVITGWLLFRNFRARRAGCGGCGGCGSRCTGSVCPREREETVRRRRG